MTMKLIVGLGNPGKEYARTRHNAGFLVVDELAKQFGGEFQMKKALQAEVASIMVDGQLVTLMKPQTFMNDSGTAVRAFLSQSNLQPSNVLVVLDEADISFGELRARPGGGSAGHNGMKSIQAVFPANTDIPRLRVGVGRSPNTNVPLDVWVLGKWSQEEEEKLPSIITAASDEATRWITS